MKLLKTIAFLFVAISGWSQATPPPPPDTIRVEVKYQGSALDGNSLVDSTEMANAIANAILGVIHPPTDLNLNGNVLESSTGSDADLSSLLGSGDNVYNASGTLTATRVIQTSGFPFTLRHDDTEPVLQFRSSPQNVAEAPMGALEWYNLDGNGTGPSVQARIIGESALNGGGGIHLKFFTDNSSTGLQERFRIHNAYTQSFQDHIVSENIGVGTSNPLVRGDFRATINDGNEVVLRASELNVLGRIELGVEEGSGYIEGYSTGGGDRLKLSTHGGDQYIDPVTESRYGFNSNAPASTFDIGEFEGAVLTLHRSDNSTSPGNLLGAINFDNTDGGISTVDASASIRAHAIESQGVGDKGASLSFFVKPQNRNSDEPSVEVMKLDQNGKINIGQNALTDAMLITKNVGNNSSQEGLYIDQNASHTSALTGNRTHRGMFIDYDAVSVDEGTRNLTIYNLESQIMLSGANATGANNVRNYTGLIRNDAPSGIIDNAYSFYAWVNQDDAGSTTNNAHGYYSRLDRDNGTAINGYLYRGVFQGTWTGDKWGVHMLGETKNYFSGSVGINETEPEERLHVNGNIKASGSFIGDGSQLTGVSDDQQLSISGNTISLENGGDVTLPTATVEARIPFPYNAGFGNGGGGNFTDATYYKHSERVYLEGFIGVPGGPGMSINTDIGVLPVGYRPQQQMTFATSTGNADFIHTIRVFPDGRVTYVGSNQSLDPLFVCIDNLSFRI